MPALSSRFANLLLATAPRSGNISEVWMWSAILMGVLLVGMVAIVIARRYLYSESGSTDAGFSLESLRRLHRAGEMTDQEFEAAKNAMIGKLRGEQEPAGDEGEAAPESAAPGSRTRHRSENGPKKNPSDASAEAGDTDEGEPNERA